MLALPSFSVDCRPSEACKSKGTSLRMHSCLQTNLPINGGKKEGVGKANALGRNNPCIHVRSKHHSDLPSSSIISAVCVLHRGSHPSLFRPPSPASELPMVVCDAEEGLGEGSAAPLLRFTNAGSARADLANSSSYLCSLLSSAARTRTASAACAGMVLGDPTSFSLRPTPDFKFASQRVPSDGGISVSPFSVGGAHHTVR
ncbi:hypothetical protein B0H14DRAFT_2925095 [Mycena olivaceomarginata]|nr:hypothetical protein B0H14DRAFT_2925095 [Mycena olivaceomarginata]